MKVSYYSQYYVGRAMQRIVLALITSISFSSLTQAQTSGQAQPVTITDTPAAPTSELDNKKANPASIEKVEVIGTRLKRIATEGPSSVKTITKEAMENSANLTVSDSLRDSNAATFGVSRETAGSSSAATAM